MIKKIIVISTCLVMLSLVLNSQDTGFFKKNILFEVEDNSRHSFRIPAIVVTKSGNMLAFVERRGAYGLDHEPSKIVYKTSYDCGENWSSLSTMPFFHNSMTTNGSPAVDFYEDIIHFVFTIGPETVYYTNSKDDGQTWSDTVNLTYLFDNLREIYPWKVVAIGPGHGTQLTNGRILFPLWLSESTINASENRLSHYPSISGVLYSDDHGKSWALGDIVCNNNDTTMFPNESSCIELNDGRVMFNIRNESINYRRLITYSPDGISDWSMPIFSDNFFEPICHASMIRFSVAPFQSKNRILFCNPDSRMNQTLRGRGITFMSGAGRRRSNLTMRMSYDEALSFPVSKEIESGLSGYSDITVSAEGIIHCLYEAGSKNDNASVPDKIILASFDLQWLTEGNDFLNTDDMPVNSNVINKGEFKPVNNKRKLRSSKR